MTGRRVPPKSTKKLAKDKTKKSGIKKETQAKKPGGVTGKKATKKAKSSLGKHGTG